MKKEIKEWIIVILLWLLVISAIVISCNKAPATPNQTTKSLADSLSFGEYVCINYKVDEGPKTWYVEDTGVLLDFLANFGSTGPNVWDTNGDQEINTSDFLVILTGFNIEKEDQPDFSCYDPVFSFGEGNTQLNYTCDDSDIAFGWLHRTPYDEEYYPEDTNSFTYDLYSFTFDEVKQDSIHFYNYIKL